MEIRNDLPLPAYYKLCDNIEKRIVHYQFFAKGNEYDCSELREMLFDVKRTLGLDTREKIKEDIERLHAVVKKRIIES